jgi:hypothetical protein
MFSFLDFLDAAAGDPIHPRYALLWISGQSGARGK